MEIVDLKTLPLDAPIMVSEDGILWLRRYFSHYGASIVSNQPIVFTFPMGCTSWTAKNYHGNGMNPRASYWPKWRLPEEEEL